MSEILRGLRLFENDPRLNFRIEILMLDWAKSYPHVDLKSQIQWAHSWLEANPKKRKKDNARFLNNWMKGEERRFGERRETRPVHISVPPPKYNVAEEDVMTAEDFARMREAIRRPL